MAKRKASDVFVECLEAEGVKHVFGIPGEETLDLNESLSRSSIEFIPVRHEQGGAYMADVYGRLTGHAGVCLGTLGPGALNLVTAVADAFLDRAPLVALTGQGDLERMHKESHQYIDLLRVMRPITKWNARLSDAAIIPEVVRKAFKLAEAEKPGATHIELPEDVMVEEIDAQPLPRSRQIRSEPAARELLRAADLIRAAITPVVLAGNGVVRAKRRPGAARVRARHRHPGRGDVHGQGPDPARQPQVARLGWPAVGRLQHGRLRRGRRGAGDRLRPGRALAGALEPAPRQEDHLHRLGAGRDRRVLHPRGRADRRHLPRAHAASARSAATRLTRAARPGCATWCWAASSRPRTTTRSRCSRRARSTRSARRSGARTS